MGKLDYIRAGGNPQGQRVQALLAQARAQATQDWQSRQAVAAEARPVWAKKAADFAGKALSWISIGFTIAGLPVGLALHYLQYAYHLGCGSMITPTAQARTQLLSGH